MNDKMLKSLNKRYLGYSDGWFYIVRIQMDSNGIFIWVRTLSNEMYEVAKRYMKLQNEIERYYGQPVNHSVVR
jgi:DNA polymerase I-like protein with 3'-5' exonuclease and polymerase domains